MTHSDILALTRLSLHTAINALLEARMRLGELPGYDGEQDVLLRHERELQSLHGELALYMAVIEPDGPVLEGRADRIDRELRAGRERLRRDGRG